MIDLLKGSVENKLGKKIVYQKDCKLLSISIENTIGEHLSVATLRRFWGLLVTNSNPSKVTLDILSKYINYYDWEDFCRKNTNKSKEVGKKIIEQWSIVAENSKFISRNTVNRIKSKLGIDFEATIDRAIVEDRFQNFLSSTYGATAVVAPGGYGKSTLLAKWYLKQIESRFIGNNIILFVSAQLFEQYALSEVFIEQWFLRVIGLKPDSSFLNDFFTSVEKKACGRIVVIIDALDELTVQGSKQTKVFKGIIDLIERYTVNGCLKFIISTRAYNWDIFSKYISNIKIWSYVEKVHFSKEVANIPPFSYEEIQKIFDASINRTFSQRLLIYQLPQDVCSVIEYPYFLQLFLQLYTPEGYLSLSDEIGLINEFLKKQVYLTPDADEKNDILNFIIINSDFGSKYLLKSEIKKEFPIHLKLSGNYYSAYSELLSFGVIHEDVIIDSIGSYTRYVNLSNQHIACVLAAHCIIRDHSGIGPNIFLWVQDFLHGKECQAQIIAVIFKLAYKEHRVEALSQLFELDEDLLDSLFCQRGVFETIRADKALQNEMITIWMKSPIARRLLVEQNIDINHIVSSYQNILMSYLKFGNTKEEQFFGNVFMLFSGFITLNAKIVKAYMPQIGTPILSSFTPQLAAAWYSDMIFSSRFWGDGNFSEWFDGAYSYVNELVSEDARIDFVEIFCLVLAVLKCDDEMLRFTSPSLFGNNEVSIHRSAVIFIARNYARYKNDAEILPETLYAITQQYSCLQSQCSYLSIIMGEALRAFYYTKLNSLELAYTSFRNAMDLTSGAGIKLIESVLVSRLAMYMEQMLEDDKSNALWAYNLDLWEKSEFPKRII